MLQRAQDSKWKCSPNISSKDIGQQMEVFSQECLWGPGFSSLQLLGASLALCRALVQLLCDAPALCRGWLTSLGIPSSWEITFNTKSFILGVFINTPRSIWGFYSPSPLCLQFLDVVQKFCAQLWVNSN